MGQPFRKRAGQGPGARRVAALVVSAALLPCISQARPLTLEDLLQREAFQRLEVTSDGQRMVFEELGPTARAARFDYYQQNDMFRTRLEVADLTGVGSVRPLFRSEPGVGYKLGPLSPDGRRVAVFRLKQDVLELGVASLVGGRVRWMGVTPEWAYAVHTLQWRSPTELIVIARQFGDNPLAFRDLHTQAPLAARWAKAARGELSATVVGSGRYITDRPHASPRCILRISLFPARSTVLATGEFGDLELSSSGRWLAATRAAEDIPLDARHAVQGAYGVAIRRKRLTLVNVETGEVRDPAPDRDVLDTLLTWSPTEDRLLIFARRDGEPWPAGQLQLVDPASHSVTALEAVHAAIEHRPELAYAGWWGNTPMVFGRPAGAARDDWYRLDPKGPVNLTKALTLPPRAGLTVANDHLLLSAQETVWRIARDGAAQRLPSDGFQDPDVTRPNGPNDRAVWSVGRQGWLQGSVGPAQRRDAVQIGVEGVRQGAIPLAGTDRLFASLPKGRGAVVDRVSDGGVETLIWLTPNRAAHSLRRLNVSFARLDWPKAIEVDHEGPEGRQLRSWLLLPKHSVRGDRPPPLVIFPYPGSNFPHDPTPSIFRASALSPVALLTAQGYAVLMPSLPNPTVSDGPADHLAARLLAGVDAAAARRDLAGRFDPNRLAVWGYSFGGYAALAAVTETDRFRAAIAVAPISDLFSMEGTFTTPGRVYPDEGVGVPYETGWTEDLQGGMHGPPWTDPERFLRNSPALIADRISTPVLLFHGDQDEIPLGQSEEVFSALYRQNKDAELVTYWGQPHGIGSPGDLRDYYQRAFAWLHQHLVEDAVTASAATHPVRTVASDGPRPPPRPRG